jgi:hypothetical protein
MHIASLLLLAGSPALQGPEVDWSFLPFVGNCRPSAVVADPLGGAPYVVGEVDADQGGSGFGWHVYRHDPSIASFRILRSSTVYLERPRPPIGADLNVDGTPELLVLEDGGRLVVQDFISGAVLFDRQLATDPAELRVADLDGDGLPELVLITASVLHVYDKAGTPLWSLTLGSLLSALTVGQCDADPALEIVTNRGVVDSSTRTIQWATPPTGDSELVQADGDAAFELAHEIGVVVQIWDVESQSLLRSLNIGGSRARILDSDGDGDDEILVTEFAPGSLTAYDPITLAQLWTQALPEPYYGEYPMFAGDFDADGDRELLYHDGIVYDPFAMTELWRVPRIQGKFYGAEIGDVDGDGRDELVTASSHTPGGYGGQIFVFDEATLELEAVSQTVFNPGFPLINRIRDLKLRDVDGDGFPEILIASSALGYPAIGIIEYAGGVFTEAWTHATQPQGDGFMRVDAADVDGDGDVEILATTYEALLAPPYGNRLYVYDYNTRQLEWTTAQLHPTYMTSGGLEVADFDRDGTLEIAVMVTEKEIHVFDGVSRQEEALLVGEYTCLEQVRVGSTTHLLAGDDLGLFEVWKGGAPYSQLFTDRLSAQRLFSARVLEVLGRLTIWSVHDNALDVRLAGRNYALWTSSELGKEPADYLTVRSQNPFTFYVTGSIGIQRLRM